MEVRTCSFYKTFTSPLQKLFIFRSNEPISPCFTVAWALVPERGVLPDLKSTEMMKRPFNHIGLVPKVLYNAHEIIDCLDWQRETTNRRNYVTIFFISFFYFSMIPDLAQKKGTTKRHRFKCTVRIEPTK